MFFVRIKRAIEDPSRIKRAIQRRMPGILYSGRRAISKKINYNGLDLFKKEFRKTESGKNALVQEKLAREVFSESPWMIPIIEEGHDWITMPYLPEESRLDHAINGMDESTVKVVLNKALSILLDIHKECYYHGDFHGKNLFWYKEELLLCDYECMGRYKNGQRPPFPESFDVSGSLKGIKSLMNPDSPKMYFSALTSSNVALCALTGVSLKDAMEEFVIWLKAELRKVCAEFQSRGGRHSIRAARIYGSFSLSFLCVEPHEAQRNCAKRLAQFGIEESELKGYSLLDLGCNAGGMIFESQKYGPAISLGVEYDGDKVRVANRIAAFNGLNGVEFIQANIDKLVVSDLSQQTYDVVYCFALIEHLKDRNRLFRLLGAVTDRVLFFEGNSHTPGEEIKSKLMENGFVTVQSAGICGDDCMSDNNCRLMYVAKKNG